MLISESYMNFPVSTAFLTRATGQHSEKRIGKQTLVRSFLFLTKVYNLIAHARKKKSSVPRIAKQSSVLLRKQSKAVAFERTPTLDLESKSEAREPLTALEH